MMSNTRRVFIITTTIPGSLSFFKGQLAIWKTFFDVCAISSTEEELSTFAKKEEVNFKYIQICRDISLFKDLMSLMKYICYFVTERPQIVHGNTPKAALLSMIAAWITRVPVRIYMCHGLRYQGSMGFKRKVLKLMEKITCFCATDIICVSNGLKQVLVNDGITRKSPIVIWNGSVCGIDSIKYSPKSEEEKMDLRSNLKLNEKDYVLGFVGRIVGDKGINELVSAFLQLSSENDNLRLLLVGPMDEIGGGISEETKKIIRENNKIIITGYQEDVPLYLSLMDIFIFPTYREGFGLSLMEAAAMEIPCISSDVIGCNEIIEHETTGLLIKPKSVQEIVSAVKRLMSDEVLYQKIKNNCRQSIITRYEQEKLWADYLDFYIHNISVR